MFYHQVELKSVDEITSYTDVVIGASFNPNRVDTVYNMFSGSVDGVSFYDLELNSSEVTSIYNQGAPPGPAWINLLSLEHDEINVGEPVTWTMNIELSGQTLRGAIELPADGEITGINLQNGYEVIEMLPDYQENLEIIENPDNSIQTISSSDSPDSILVG